MPYKPDISPPIISAADQYSMGHVVPGPEDEVEVSMPMLVRTGFQGTMLVDV